MMDLPESVCFTGHRPEKLGGYLPEAETGRWVRYRLRDACQKAVDGGVSEFISGGAQGVDQWAAEIVLELKAGNPLIRLVIARPFPSHDAVWPESIRQKYSLLLERADEVIDVSPDPYAVWKMMVRNRFMVDRATRAVIAVWDGGSGGAAHCVQYARKKGRPVFHINPADRTEEWLAAGIDQAGLF